MNVQPVVKIFSVSIIYLDSEYEGIIIIDEKLGWLIEGNLHVSNATPLFFKYLL